MYMRPCCLPIEEQLRFSGLSLMAIRNLDVTIMQMDEGLDTGDMIDKVVVPIEKEETGGSLI